MKFYQAPDTPTKTRWSTIPYDNDDEGKIDELREEAHGLASDISFDHAPYENAAWDASKVEIAQLGLTLGQVDLAKANLVPFENVLNGTLVHD